MVGSTMRYATLTAVILLLILAPTTRAAQLTMADLTNPAPATDPLITSALTVADQWWIAHGYGQPCKTTPLMVTTPMIRAAATNTQDGCGLWIDRGFLATVHRAIHPDSPIRVYDPVDVLADFCAAMIHERGHNLGLAHTTTGIMAINDPGFQPPGECVAWAAHVYHHRHRALEAKRYKRHS